MATDCNFNRVLFSLLCFCSILPLSYTVNFIEYQTPNDCITGGTTGFNQYFDISQLQCHDCAGDVTEQTVSPDGLRCMCQPGYKLTQDFGGGVIECEPCNTNDVVDQSGWECVKCSTDGSSSSEICPACSEGKIEVERELDGSWSSGTQERTCEVCAEYTHAVDDSSRCERCNQILSVLDPADDVARKACACSQELVGGVCFRDTDDVPAEEDSLYEVVFGEEAVTSAFFKAHIRAAATMCGETYSNKTACQVLGHLCTMIMYNGDPDSRIINNACGLYLDQADGKEWPENMPWLYYLGAGDDILKDDGIPTEFTFPDSKLDFVLAKYSLNGTFIEFVPVTGGTLQLCQNSRSILDAAYLFGTSYEQECEIPVADFWDTEEHELYFYDMYLEYESAGTKQLYAIPVLVENYEDANGNNVNQEKDRSDWQLVRRFFLVDNISGKQDPGSTGFIEEEGDATIMEARAVRFAQEMTIYIDLQESSKDGRIYPPYLRIRYNHALTEDKEEDKKTRISFRVKYSMNLVDYENDVSIAAGVLSAFAIVYAFVQTWGWYKRSGKMAIDFVTLIKFLMFLLGDLANVFFVVTFGVGLWWLIFYKNQNAVYLIVPNSDEETQFIALLAIGFGLKIFHLIHLFISQVTIDIFFVDWEKPHGKVMASNDAQQVKGQEPSVSIWRTYFVANEWNEIQTVRKINPIFQIFAVIFFLHVVGFENWATSDPHSKLSLSGDEYHSEDSRIFRYTIGVLVWIVIAVIQWIFYTLLYQRFIEDKVRQYVDLCSMSNISVFILENSVFGYYIHGRSPHGRADTGMKEMYENLKREQADLCGQRGLDKNSEQQTFQMSVPRKLRIQYDRVLLPINTPAQGATAAKTSGGGGLLGASHVDPHTLQCIQAYGIINRFLQAFVDHSLKDIDYIIHDKLLFESILNMEFKDTAERGALYNDSGHSFDAVLFFGHETTLSIFEMLLFSVLDLISQNFVLAAVLTFLVMEIVCMLRDAMGRSNLAKKTLIDKRFLI